MTKVYAVICGQYSDKFVAGVFSDEDAAYNFAYSNDGHVVEHVLDEIQVERKLKPGERLYHVRMNTDGNNATAEMLDYNVTDMPELSVNSRQQLIGLCFAMSREHAIKIINERRTSWLAHGKKTKPNKDNQYWDKAVYK